MRTAPWRDGTAGLETKQASSQQADHWSKIPVQILREAGTSLKLTGSTSQGRPSAYVQSDVDAMMVCRANTPFPTYSKGTHWIC